jgi:PAS domain S-box-containing protein
MHDPEDNDPILRLVRELGQHAFALASTPDIETMANTLLRIVDEIVSVDRSGFYFIDPDTDTLRLLAARGFSETERHEAEKAAWARHPGDVFRSGQALHVPDVDNDPGHRTRSSDRSFVIQDRLYIPVRIGTEVVGALGLGSETPYFFQPIHLETLQFVAAVSGAIYARLLEHNHAVRSWERLELVLDGAALGMWDWNIESGDVVFNHRWAEMLGYRLNELEPNVDTWERLVHPDDLPGVRRALQAHFAGETPGYRTEHRLRTRSGGWCWVLDAGRIVQRSSDGRPLRMAGIHQDITREKLARQELREHHNQLESLVAARTRELRTVAQELRQEVRERAEAQNALERAQARLRKTTEALILAEEDERRRLANQLHDGLGQDLTALRIGLRSLRRVGRDPRLDPQFEALDHTLQEIIHKTRDLTTNLSPAVLYQFGLAAALEDLAVKTGETYALDTHFRQRGEPGALPRDLEVMMYGSARELIHNAVKHAQAGRLWVELASGRDGTLAIEVSDDGLGIPNLDTDKLGREATGHGLYSIRERMANIGGTMDVSLREGGGTTVRLRARLRGGE